MLQYAQQNLIILSLQKQLRRYKQQLQLWKQKYSTLEKQHRLLLEHLSNNNTFETVKPSKQQQQIAFLSTNTKHKKSQQASMQLHEDESFIIDNDINQNHHIQQVFSSIGLEQIKQNEKNVKLKKVLSPIRSIKKEIKTEDNESIIPWLSQRYKEDDNNNDIDFFSMEQQIQKQTSCEQSITSQIHCDSQSSIKKKGLSLIEGYFILQKIPNFDSNIKNYNQWIKNASECIQQKQKNLLEIIYRYTFGQQSLLPIQDDPFDSRVNEIKYGTPYEELIYSFDNFQPNEQDRSKIIFKTTRKKYVHCLIRPEITQIQGQQFETEIIYAFVSPFPFRTFFQDLHRTLQQQIKFEIMSSNRQNTQEVYISKSMRIEILSTLMKQIYQKSNEVCSNIQNFPIKVIIETKVSTLKLNIESQDDFKRMERDCLQILIKKYNLLKLCKIIHYILTEKQIILVSNNRKNLNEIFQIVRLMIKPFFWVFPIVYRYSNNFEPFLSSPLPLIIGIVFDFNNKNYKDNKILTTNDFVTIFVEQNNPSQKETFFFFSSNKPKYSPNDLRQMAIYEKDIQFLYKYLTKPDKKSKSNQSQKIQKYVNRLKRLILTGSLDSELSTFMIQFLDTQMVQSFRDLLHGGSNRKLDPQDDCNEELTMTK